MKTRFTYNFIEKAIIGSKAAIERANKGKNPEYAELSGMLEAHPDFTVKVKDIQQKEGKKTYSKLIEFKAIQDVAEAKGAKYPLTKKWFFAAYPEFKVKEVSEKERAEKEKTLLEEEKKAAYTNAEAMLEALEETEELEKIAS